MRLKLLSLELSCDFGATFGVIVELRHWTLVCGFSPLSFLWWVLPMDFCQTFVSEFSLENFCWELSLEVNFRWRTSVSELSFVEFLLWTFAGNFLYGFLLVDFCRWTSLVDFHRWPFIVEHSWWTFVSKFLLWTFTGGLLYRWIFVANFLCCWLLP